MRRSRARGVYSYLPEQDYFRDAADYDLEPARAETGGVQAQVARSGEGDPAGDAEEGMPWGEAPQERFAPEWLAPEQDDPTREPPGRMRVPGRSPDAAPPAGGARAAGPSLTDEAASVGASRPRARRRSEWALLTVLLGIGCGATAGYTLVDLLGGSAGSAAVPAVGMASAPGSQRGALAGSAPRRIVARAPAGRPARGSGGAARRRPARIAPGGPGRQRVGRSAVGSGAPQPAGAVPFGASEVEPPGTVPALGVPRGGRVGEFGFEH